tara:strand:+ start:24442 stop:25248 length:807 start_codon:yes stop_codon:yes gene_type:complete
MFKTDFICILTAGHTVDGREVSLETLQQIVETYDPETYNARINIDHSEYGSKLGSVLAVKLEGNKLLGQLKPNDYLLYLIQQGQYLHTSCEIVMNFAKTGKAYLTGLALTDSPASLGTTELHLSKKETGTELFNTNNGIAPQKPTLLNKILKQKDDEMADKATLEMLTQMQAENAKQTAALTKLAEGITSLSENLTTQNELETEAPKPKETETEGESDLEEKLSAFKKELTDSFSSQITTLKETLSKVTDEPERDEATGGDLEDEEVY